MATITDFNVSPYYDDFADSNNYHRVLFRPSYALQARELTQAQTILQAQIERFGNHVFKEGDVVVPGAVQVAIRDSVKLTSSTGTSTLSDLKGIVLTGATSGMTAKVIETSGSNIPFTMIKPSLVIEIESLDIINSNTDGAISKSVLSFDTEFSKTNNSPSGLIL